MADVLLKTDIEEFAVRRGKVRDIIDLDDMLLIVATDRISAFDCILPTGIPNKGRVLTQLSTFWFEFFKDTVKGHMVDAPLDPEEITRIDPQLEKHAKTLVGRSMFVHKAEDGSFEGFGATNLSDMGVGDMTVFEGASSGILGDDDVSEAASALEPGEAAVLLMYENRWAAPFAAAVRRNGGVLLDNQRIPHEDVLAALELAESAAT